MQSILHSAVNSKDDACRIKKKIKGDRKEMKIQLSKADHQAFESQKLLRYVHELLKVGYRPLIQHSCSQKAAAGRGMMVSPVKIHD